MLLRAFLVGLVLTVTPAATVSAATPEPTTPPVTANPFIPEDRSITECVSALPKPGCGSEERGGLHQYLVFVALVGGLSVIGWRIIAGVRNGRPGQPAPSEADMIAAATRADSPPAPATMDVPSDRS